MTADPQHGASSDGDRPETLDTQGGSPESRSFEDRTGNAAADAAVTGGSSEADRSSHAPHARPARDGNTDDLLADKLETAENRQEALVDEAVEETFPASDPISPKHIT